MLREVKMIQERVEKLLGFLFIAMLVEEVVVRRIEPCFKPFVLLRFPEIHQQSLNYVSRILPPLKLQLICRDNFKCRTSQQMIAGNYSVPSTSTVTLFF